MAFPVVAAVNGGNNPGDTANHTVNLPAGINAGDLLLVFFASDGNPTIGFPGGWTCLFQEWAAGGSPAVRFGCWYRIADGGEGATINVTTSASERSAHTSYRIVDYFGVPEAGTPVASGPTPNPDPPSSSPSWGALDTLWLAACGYDSNKTVTFYPTNYTDGRNDLANQVDGCGVGTARRELNAASENPGTFTISGNDQWVANTVAIQPKSIPVGGGAGGVTSAAGILLVGA